MRAHQDHARVGDGNSLVAAPTSDPILISEFDVVDRVAGRWTTGNLWNFYERTFVDINELAAQRHLMTYAEFAHVMLDDRVRKFVARQRRDEQVAGLAVMTDDLAAWTLVAPEFFARRYPGRKVFYVGFVASNGAPGAYAELVAAMYRHVIAEGGVFAMDFAGHNIDRLDIARRVQILLGRLNPKARFELADRQEFWVGDFRVGDDV